MALFMYKISNVINVAGTFKLCIAIVIILSFQIFTQKQQRAFYYVEHSKII